MLKIKDLNKKFEDKTVLDELNIEIQDSSIFGLVGVNGAGKTTLLRCIAGVYQSDNGEINFNGFDTSKDYDIRKEVILVNDDSYFPMASTIKSLKEFYNSFYLVDENALKSYLELFNLDENKPITSFSKGMKRQVSLAFALAIKPKLLLLDEAFDGLDPIVRFNLKKVLGDFISDNDAIIIISSHNLKELEDICDSFGILENGKIQTYGDLIESKQNINKYLLAFKENIDEEIFKDFDVMFKTHEGTIYTLVIKGNKEEITSKLEKFKPAVLNVVPVNFEELFIYEKGGKE